MDALIKAAIDSLVIKVLPALNQELASLQTHSDSPDQKLNAEGTYLINECRELLDLVKSGLSIEITDTKTNANVTGEAQAAPIASPASINDDEAMRLLAEMETPLTTDTAPPIAKPDSMNDDEAMRLLAEMEAPASPPVTEAKSMNDDEAIRLLAEMEAPASPATKEVKTESRSDTPTSEITHQKVDEEAGHDDEDFQEIDEWEPNDFQTDPEMIRDFITNADEIMNAVDEAILKLEQSPNEKEIIEEIFRGAHTLKGAAGMFGFRAMERVMHRMENLFDLIRKNRLVPSSDTIDVVFAGLDLQRELLTAVKKGKPCGIQTAPIVKALAAAAKGRKAELAPTERSDTAIDQTAKSPVKSTETLLDRKPKSKDLSPASKKEQSNQKKEQSTIRVDLERLDVLVNLVGELVIDRTRFASIEEDLRTKYPNIEIAAAISETIQLFGRHMNEIQDTIMKVRMVPIGNAFNKFSRIVRDLARSLKKNIELVISGEHAELDKTLVEQIGDPLIHLIRNSCDHGIENPETRQKAGKDPVGKIKLSAHQEGNHIIIAIEDDGKGIDPGIIRKKGIEKGLISDDENLSDRDIFNLIFEPGFSTADQVTNISGRGVGMDVVKKQIMKLKGMIEIDSSVGKGTKISIRLPLTLAIVQSLLVRSKDEVFAIPLSTVIESIRISPKEIQRVGDTEVYKLRDKVLPLIHLNEALGLDRKQGGVSDLINRKASFDDQVRFKSERVFIVVVGHNDRPTGIVVDQLLNQQEMVIKSMGSLMRNIPCVAGGAVLGHGEVVLVLDIPELVETLKGRFRGIQGIAG